jgi:hypothetical protein
MLIPPMIADVLSLLGQQKTALSYDMKLLTLVLMPTFQQR